MEQITLGQIGLATTFIIGIISGFAYLKTNIEKWISTSLKDEFEKVDDKIDKMQARLDAIDINTCKNFLVRSLTDIEDGRELDEVNIQRFWEQYEHYIEVGGNTYIQRKVEQLKAEGKL